MKTNLLRSILALIALCSVVSLHAEINAAAGRRLTGELPVNSVNASVGVNGDTVTAGTSRVMVSLRLGTPNAVLADGSSGYQAKQNDQVVGATGALIVRFAANKVSSLTIADQVAVVALRQAPKALASDQVLVAKQKR